MRQVIQNYKTGELRLEEVPTPIAKRGSIIVRTAYSLVSVGTERMKVTQARMNLVQMAKARPDKVKQVLQSVKQVGLADTYQKVRERLDALTTLGYSLAGTVVEVGEGIDEFEIGDAVACAGEGIACHAEFVCVPRNLCVKIPANVDLKNAAYATVGAIAMNGVRQSGVVLGDSVLVIGLGLVGLLAVQILKAAGCRVIGVDLDPTKVELAKTCGADLAMVRQEPGLEESIQDATDGIGVDAVYVAASTKSTDPMDLAGKVLRDRGVAVVVGMVPVEADWQTYYQKELSVIMSRSYGPGRYDRDFEHKGIRYPVGWIKWTQRRNLQEFLRLVGADLVRPTRLDPQVFEYSNAPEAYQALHESPGRYAAGILFKYDQRTQLNRKVVLSPTVTTGRTPSGDTVAVGIIGAGNFATGTLIPALKKCQSVSLRAICSAGGLSAKSAAGRHGFEYCVSDYQELLADDSIDAVVIATRHDTHARFTVDALRAGKHVFVEKPLAMNRDQLDDVIAAQQEAGLSVVPGFNRRFSPLAVEIRKFFSSRQSPIEVVCRVNAGEIKADSWYQDSDEGGWRIISEGCHFIDLIQFICGCQPERVFGEIVGGAVAGAQNDNCAVTMKMEDGSLGTLVYVANGAPSYEKERIEVFGRSSTAVIENWHAARIHEGSGVRKIKPAGGKGHREEMAAFIRAIASGEPASLSFEEAVATTLTTFAIETSIASGRSELVFPS